MKISYFRYGYRDGRELNLRIGIFSFRLARYQIAMWRNTNVVWMRLWTPEGLYREYNRQQLWQDAPVWVIR